MNEATKSEFEQILSSTPLGTERGAKSRVTLDIDPEKLQNGMAQLVLTLLKLVHELLEKQAIRRMDSGSLEEEEIEKLGMALMQQSEELDYLRQLFNLDEKDLNIDLGPLGKLL